MQVNVLLNKCIQNTTSLTLLVGTTVPNKESPKTWCSLSPIRIRLLVPSKSATSILSVLASAQMITSSSSSQTIPFGQPSPLVIRVTRANPSKCARSIFGTLPQSVQYNNLWRKRAERLQTQNNRLTHRVGGNRKRNQQSTNADQKSIETAFSLAICRQWGDK